MRHVRWEPAAGVVDHFFDDEPVPGTHGRAARRCCGRWSRFPTAELVPYDTAFLSGFVVEHYQVVLLDAAKQSQAQMRQALEQLCGRQVPGDTYRNLRIHPVFSGETFKHILVPVWLLTYTYGRKTFQVLVNGYTGRIAGKYPLSVWRVLAVIVAGLIAVGVVAAHDAVVGALKPSLRLGQILRLAPVRLRSGRPSVDRAAR